MSASDEATIPRDSHRYSTFDTQLFSLNASSPAQAKRALEAHLAETERRLEDASRLGTALVQQQKELSDKLKEIEHQQDEGEIGPELRRKLVDLEREYNEIGRESARAFLAPKRLVSGAEENGLATPSVDLKVCLSNRVVNLFAILTQRCSRQLVRRCSRVKRSTLLPRSSVFHRGNSATNRRAASTISNSRQKSRLHCLRRSGNSKRFLRNVRKP